MYSFRGKNMLLTGKFTTLKDGFGVSGDTAILK